MAKTTTETFQNVIRTPAEQAWDKDCRPQIVDLCLRKGISLEAFGDIRNRCFTQLRGEVEEGMGRDDFLSLFTNRLMQVLGSTETIN